MKVLIQRVQRAAVQVDGRCVGSIDAGLLALVGIAPSDTDVEAARLIERVLGYRVFSDAQGRMNLALREVNGGLLLVPNFTLMADTRKGMRPSFTPAAAPQAAAALFERLCGLARGQWPATACGVFGADMQVELVNDGPVTLMLEI